MSGYRGRLEKIIRFIDPEPVPYRGKWGRRADLACGHTVYTEIQDSPKHRKTKPAKTGFCTVCPPREKQRD